VDGGSRPVYRGLYFNLARNEDVELLGWLLAIPRSRRTRAIKAVLQTGLPSYVTARYPGVAPLPPDTVRAVLGTPRRPRSGLQGAPTTAVIGASPRPPEGPPGAAAPAPDTASGPSGEPVNPRVVAEARLARLLQSFR